MGGNALHFETRRIDAKEYVELVNEIRQLWMDMPKQCIYSSTDMPYAVKSYRNKKDFGDIDFVIKRDPTLHYRKAIQETYSPKEIFSNGGAHSFDYKGVQIDFITVRPEEFETSLNYFAFNDLGNLMGRIAHKMGLKYGHHGLSVLIKDGDYLIEEIVLTRDRKEIFEFLGYDADVRDFAELKDIFDFVRSSMYYSGEIFKLENRNAIARIRERKRKTYMAFLQYIQENPIANEFPWEDFKDKSAWQLAAIKHFNKMPLYVSALKEQKARLALKERFSGNHVREITGLRNQELGEFMKSFKDAFPKDTLFMMSKSQILAEIENFERKFA